MAPHYFVCELLSHNACNLFRALATLHGIPANLIPEMRRNRRSLKGSSAVFGLLEGNPEYQCWFCQPVLCGIW